MRIGVFVSETWNGASDLSEVRRRARQAQEQGFASGWVPYLPWSLDALASLQAAGEVTSHLELGTAVIPTYLIHPLALARQAATVQSAIGRPLTLGIGCSNVHVIEMHGLAYERPARHVREYLEVLHRAAESEGSVSYAGELFRVEGLYQVPGSQVPGSQRTPMKKQGYQTFEALNAREALKKAREVNPDAVVLDIMMPEIDGRPPTGRGRSSASTMRCRATSG
jgi:CheY-like chemotaxis protein